MKDSKKREQSQEELVTAVFAELDEDILALGPRLFDDKYYDDTIKLAPVVKGKRNDKVSGQKGKA